MATLCRRATVMGIAMLPIVIVAGIVVGQQRDLQQAQPRGQAGQGVNRGGAMSQLDQQIITTLITENEGEISIAKLAQEKAKSDDVKQFAQDMVKDHTKLIDQLEKLAPGTRGRRGFEQGNRNEAGARAGGQAQGARTERAGGFDQPQRNSQAGQAGQVGQAGQAGQLGQPGQRGGLVAGGAVDFFQINQEICQQVVQSLRRELEEKQGVEFDKAFVGSQIMGHIQMLDSLKVFSKFASPQLRQILADAQKTTEEHLQHARKLMRDLDEKGNKVAKE